MFFSSSIHNQTVKATTYQSNDWADIFFGPQKIQRHIITHTRVAVSQAKKFHLSINAAVHPASNISTLTNSVDSSFNDDAADHVFLFHPSIYSAGSITDWTRKRVVTCHNNRDTNRERELKAIAELLPNEVPTIEKRKVNKDQEKKPSIVVIKGRKPGTSTDLSRMRQLLLKLKHNAPNHLNPAPAAPACPVKGR
ncbi:hypothetical protein EZV62_026022 [Acer yangbiense]|uniref:Uncharacterized protein n=1 Tax=Acer yangbiense TaxID=1000413 RepID=A0A5C7H022_9ROSI|nr:hypothetical protein EZV62_026022 [Acer yangbiense]